VPSVLWHLVGHQEEYLACGEVLAVRCKWFAPYGPTDATATDHHLLH